MILFADIEADCLDGIADGRSVEIPTDHANFFFPSKFKTGRMERELKSDDDATMHLYASQPRLQLSG